MICSTLVNIQTHTQTAFWPVYMKSSASWAKTASKDLPRTLNINNAEVWQVTFAIHKFSYYLLHIYIGSNNNNKK